MYSKVSEVRGYVNNSTDKTDYKTMPFVVSIENRYTEMQYVRTASPH